MIRASKGLDICEVSWLDCFMLIYKKDICYFFVLHWFIGWFMLIYYRGICYFFVEVESSTKDLHSGLFGGSMWVLFLQFFPFNSTRTKIAKSLCLIKIKYWEYTE